MLVVVGDPKQAGLMRRIGSAREAAEILLMNWPKEGRGELYWAPMKACHNALAGKVKVEAVRQAFIAAARECRDVPPSRHPQAHRDSVAL
jgi:hypothetical protein